MTRRSRKIYKLCRIHPFHLFLCRLVTSSFASVLEKFLNYTVSPLTFFVQTSPREMMPQFMNISIEIHASRISKYIHKSRDLFMRGVILLSHLISFHQFFEMLFQNINLFFSNFNSDIKNTNHL